MSLLLAGCQGGINHGTSSHVSVGASATPPPPVPRTQAQPRPTPVPAPRQQQQPPPPQGETRVQVRPANPQQGVPLGDDTELDVESLAPPPSTAPATRSAAPAAAATTAAVAARQQEAVPPEHATWLDRYPNLAEDLQDQRETIARLEQEVKEYREQVGQLQQQVRQRWGSTAVTAASAHQFVKYTDSYQSRGEMDFDQGVIIVETVDQENPRQRLKEAIVTTLLTPYDADNPEIYSDKSISYSGPALLAGQVLDHEGQPVRWEWRANRFADHLVNNEVQQLQRNGHVVYRVEIPLIANHTEVRGHQYEHLVRDASRRYNVDETLIYAIMETESHFNPYATSHIPAYGLMQIVPSTAGRDVFERIKKRNDQPTRNYLFNPANNIDTGTAYITILRDIYLKDIRHPLSKEYAIISGYNGGAGNVLRTFHSDRRQAINVINQLTPQQVYDRLHRNHPSAEARGYIKKVTEAQQRYRALASAR
ncbi:membrane-bound lytic murein transglycosylase MltC [Marinospirillum alkaliphilum]|nr:membrane-bound lytic murein transglycosylase MltC [Marinospirillum alkaliphilum]